ncbi:hypothetical protein BXU11_03790 [Flavobacterium sp. LM5]|uniref:hypothetical protein n=1 Tax=Flavobacterium sp. LM5 TaxID=1938610 RepID=UPI000992C409|nr:hypothetical protein [Flavobacterium sp. LM5]OOV29060.1 hypothetical protein BXU11_03790 [Flavobacterium sp. LM5]
MKINLIRNERKWKLLLVSIFFITISVQSQCVFDMDVKSQLAKTKLLFSKPDNYFCINPPSSYFSIHHDVQQSMFDIAIINNDNEVMICITTIAYPKPIGKINKFLIATVDLNHISKKGLAIEMDTRLSQLRFVKTDYLKKINADRGYVYNLKVRKGGYLGIYPRCKKVIVYKDNVGRAEILFFYKYGQDNLVNQEIEKTWGSLKFKS